jgi:DUF971 family protein
MKDPKLVCKVVRSPRGAKATEIEWGDGHKSVYPHEILRGYCPCAACQGHEGTIKFVSPSSTQLELDVIEPVGNYALRLDWFDGHSSGIYSYKYLRSLCHCEECRPGAAKDDRGELARM